MTPLFPDSNLKTDSCNSELGQSDVEFASYNKCENEYDNKEDIESIGEEYIEVDQMKMIFLSTHSACKIWKTSKD